MSVLPVPDGPDDRLPPAPRTGSRRYDNLPQRISAEVFLARPVGSVTARSWWGCQRDRTGRPAEETEPDMTTTTVQIPTSVTTSGSAPATPRVWKHGVAAAIVASIATTSLAAIASAAGVSFADSSGKSIPMAGFTQLTLVFSLIGVGIAAVMARKARRPRSTFVRTALGLTVLSFVPDLTFGFDAGSAATLITLHTVAAAIVVPTVARRLLRTR